MRRYSHQDFIDFRQHVRQQNGADMHDAEYRNGGHLYGNGYRNDQYLYDSEYRHDQNTYGSDYRHDQNTYANDYRSDQRLYENDYRNGYIDPYNDYYQPPCARSAAQASYRPMQPGELTDARSGHLDRFANSDHRVEEPLEGLPETAKLSYSLAGPFNRKVIGFDHGPQYDGPPPPRLARPPSPDGGSEADGANRLKRRLQGLGPASPDRAALVNGLSGSEKSLTQLQQQMKRQQLHEKENRHRARMSQSANAGLPSNCPAGRIDEKPGLRSAGPLARKVVQGPTGPEYRGFSRSSGPAPARSSGGMEANFAEQMGGRRAESYNSLASATSQASSRKPTRKEDISTRSWRKGQELILRELGPNKHTRAKARELEEPLGAVDDAERAVPDYEEEEEEEEAAAPAVSAKRNKLSSGRTAPQATAESGPKTKSRHYDVTEVRSFLRRRQEQRRRRRQEEEEASRTRLAQIRQQVADLRDQQMAALGGRKRRPTNLNKTYVIEPLGEEVPEEDGDEEEPLQEDMPMIEDGPMTLEDLEVTCEEPGYRAPREKYQEVWPASNGAKARTPDPPQEVASRLTALEESASLLQSRLWQLAQRFTPGQPASTASDEPPRAGLAHSVPYRSSAPSSVTSDPPPAYLSRYDRIRWGAKGAGPLEMEDDLPGNHVVEESQPPRFQFPSAFVDDSVSDLSDASSVPPVIPKQAFRQEYPAQPARQPVPRPARQPSHKPGLQPALSRSHPVQPARSARPRRPAPLNLDKDPFAFMRTFRKQRHRHTHAAAGDAESEDDDHRLMLAARRAGDEASEEPSEREEEAEAMDYSDDFEQVDSGRPVLRDQVDADDDEEEEEEEDYEEDFTSVGPGSSSVRSARAPALASSSELVGASSEMVGASSEMVGASSDLIAASSEMVGASSEMPGPSEARDQPGDLPHFHNTLPRDSATLRIAGAGPEVPPNDGRLSPGSLERRLLAELHFLESMEESVRQLTDIERVRAVSMSQQETVSLAQMLKSRQVQHRQELQQQQLATSAQVEQARERLAAENTNKVQLAKSAGLRATHDEALQVTLSRSHPSTSSSSSRRAAPEEVSTSRGSAADTDVDDSTLRTDTSRHDQRGSGSSSIDEDELSHSFRQLLPSEAHRRKGRRQKAQNAPSEGPAGSDESNKSSSFRRFTDDMVRQYVREEEVRSQHQTALLKLRKNALGEKMRTELEFLETQKRQLAKQRGSQASLKQLLAKQAALVRRWKDEAAELDKLLLAQRLADERRRLMLEQDARLRRDAEVRQPGDSVEGKRPAKKSLSDREQRLQQRRQRAEELIKWQEKLQAEEERVRALEQEAIQIWSGSKSSEATSPATSTAAGGPSPATSSRSSSGGSSPPSVRRKAEPEPSDESSGPRRLHLGQRTSSEPSSITEELSTASGSQASVVQAGRSESSIQEEVPQSSASIVEEVTQTSPTASVRTEVPPSSQSVPEATMPSASYSHDFESASSSVSRLKRRLRGAVPSSLTSPRAPLRPAQAPAPARGNNSEDEDSYATTTVSDATEMSEMEGRLHALKEDLKNRVRIVNRLKREQARVNRERLKQKEDLLHKHIQMYDNYISDLRAELEDPRDISLLDSSLGPLVKPMIRAPRATTREPPRRSEGEDEEEADEPKTDQEADYSTTFASGATKTGRATESGATAAKEEEKSDYSSTAAPVTSKNGRKSDYSSTAASVTSKTGVKSDYSSAEKEEEEADYSATFGSETGKKDSSRTEISEHIPTAASSERLQDSEESRGRSVSEQLASLSKDDSSNSTSVRSVSEALSGKPTSEPTANGATEEEEEEEEEVTPRTPRRLTFSEINEEYSASDPETRSKDSASEPLLVIKPLPALNLGPVSAEPPKEPPLLEPNPALDLDPVAVEPPKPLPALDLLPMAAEPHRGAPDLPLSARTIHSEMSDFPEDPPLSGRSSDYSYSEEFATSEMARSRSASSASSVSASTLTPAAESGAHSVQEALEAEEEEEEEDEEEELLVLQKKVEENEEEHEDEEELLMLQKKMEEMKAEQENKEELLMLQKKMEEMKAEQEDEEERLMHQKIEEEKEEEEALSLELQETRDEEEEEEEEMAKEEKVVKEEEEEIENLSPKETKPKLSDERIAAIAADILRQALLDSLTVGLSAVHRPEEEELADIETVASISEEGPEIINKVSEAREDGKTTPTRDSSPLSWTSPVELAAEDEMVEEYDRLLARRRNKRRISGSEEASPSATPSPGSSPVPALQDVSFDSLVTSTPAPAKPAPEPPVAEPPPSPPPPPPPPQPPQIESPLSMMDADVDAGFLVPHNLSQLREMAKRAVNDLWPFLSGPGKPRLDRLPTQPSFDFCLIGEEDIVQQLEAAAVPEQTLVRSRRAYKRMVYNLILDTVRRIYAEEPALRPWMCARPTRFRLWRDTKPPDSAERLLAIVEEEIGAHMGFMPSRKRESKLTRWSRRKRAGLGAAIAVDPVDDLLKSELRTEEADWVNYEKEEVQVKLQVADGILADLIDDTLQAVQRLGLSAPIASALPPHLARDVSVGWLDDSNPSLIL